MSLQEMAAQGDASWLGTEREELVNLVGQALRRRAYQLATAESCTGGLLAAHITSISGSSDYYVGGVVAYANHLKSGVLGVSAETLEAHGAVSWQTAVQMAWGAIDLLRADLALSTTGIAGPTGGTALKPVGLVYIALASHEKAWWHRLQWRGTRGENNMQTVVAALTLLRCYLQEGQTTLPPEMSVESSTVRRQEPAGAPPSSGGLPTIVEFKVQQDGVWVPVAFHWQEQRHPVASRGRSWEDVSGRKHFLVMTQGRGTFELIFDPAQERWGIHPISAPTAIV